MRCLLIVLLVLLVFLLVSCFLLPKTQKKSEVRVVPPKGTKLYGADNSLFLPYPQVDWSAPTNTYNDNIARFLFALSWNSTSGKITSQKIPVPADFDILVELKSKPYISELKETYGLFLHSSSLKVSVISFGGTESEIDIYDDLSYSQTSPEQLNVSDPTVMVHAGFYGAYMDVRAQLRELTAQYQGSLFACGYSMGSGLLGICALDFADDPDLKMCLSFASPRVVNPSGSKYLTSVPYYRVANSEDIVPYLPPPIISDIIDYGDTLYYEHVGENIVYTDNLLSILDNHSTAYRKYMGF